MIFFIILFLMIIFQGIKYKEEEEYFKSSIFFIISGLFIFVYIVFNL